MSVAQAAGHSGAVVSAETSACASVGTCVSFSASGGRIFRTLPCLPVVPTRTPRRAHPVAHLARSRAVGLAGRGVGDELDAPGEADAADVADLGSAGRRFDEGVAQDAPGSPHPVEHALVVDDVQDGERGGGADGVTAEGAEQRRPSDELGDDFPPGDHCGDGVTVAHGFAERDEVGDDVEAVEAPERLTGAGVP